MDNKKKINPWGGYAKLLNETETPSSSEDPIEEVEIWDKYNFNAQSNVFTNFFTVFSMAGQMLRDAPYMRNKDYSNQWYAYGSDWTKTAGDYWNNVFDDWGFSNINEFFDNFGENSWKVFSNTVLNGKMWGAIWNSTGLIFNGALNAITLAAAQGVNALTAGGRIENLLIGIENYLSNKDGNGIFDVQMKYSSAFSDSLAGITDALGNTGSVLLNIIGKGLDIWSSGALAPYYNGVAETSFGRLMESSWNKDDTGFLELIKGNGSYTIHISQSTPFDSGSDMNNLYGKMMLGAPPLFNNITDPKNRSIANTFLRDAKFLTLTPGMPKYNGSNMLLRTNDDAYHQTTKPDAMFAYLLKNGLDSDFASKDRRYYTFQADYAEYYAYLETMLNTVWIKMGLSQESATTFNIFSFFNVVDETGELTEKSTLKPQYNTSLGFFVNPSGALTENISSSPTGYDLGGEANSVSSDYQRINYITGMGTGGNIRNAAAIGAKSMQLTRQMLDFAKTAASRTISNLTGGGSWMKKLAMAVPAALGDVRDFVIEQDNGAVLQSYATTNGMRVVYPELWSDSTYTKSVNINFEFISPYGDPLSIFQYVIAPFLALLCFAMPRQAADNGYVSPFFVRADIPGLFTSDLALIQDFSWTKGGDNNLWTKDGLPRSISGSFLLTDLYPYLAMTKRLSFLSANPNYTVFLDNLASLHAVDLGNGDALNEYYKKLLNRVNGQENITSLWNSYSQSEQFSHATYANDIGTSRLGGNTKKYTSSSWLRGIK